ncbi:MULTISPECIES: hypothetical protein [Aquimarina]|uniref:hypothetical protein n=1 Tax=Aquimarina TaxID=290174 RepID=UPI0013572101|nr:MULTISPECIES: hypothetical protein [Aquimarina]
MKNKKKIGLSLKKIQISKLESSTINGGRAALFCTNDYGTCDDCQTDYRSCTDHVK